MIIRELKIEDLKNDSFFQTLSNLRPIEKMPFDLAKEIFLNCQQKGIEIYVAEDNDLIVGIIRLISEPKFYHQGRQAGHIEDVSTHPDYLGRGVAKSLINHIINLARERNYYKIILDCSEELIDFYKKFGFSVSEKNMRLNL
ncbi:MAG TPA: GNAT family N-acetyltransferase [bacterium]|nr:GNAT family N-acetyltransferase [bacterium]